MTDRISGSLGAAVRFVKGQKIAKYGGIYMQFDKDAVERLLGMNDTQLRFLIKKLATEAGLDLSSFNISSNDISSLRNALANATDEDIAKAAEQLSRLKKRKED
jgi:sugar phosphate isomerase/epimerase